MADEGGWGFKGLKGRVVEPTLPGDPFLAFATVGGWRRADGTLL